jgi:lycopene cyclase domain-containing protein
MTNLTLNIAVLVVLVAVCVSVLRRLRAWPIVCTIAHLCILTLVFDSLMIRVGLYVYDPAKIVGVYLWGAPVEDFAYAVAAGIAMPVLWTLLGRRGGRRSASTGTGGVEDPSAVEGPAV